MDTFLRDVWRYVQESASTFLMFSAISIRLAAGIYDTSRGWIAAKNHNLYQARVPVEVASIAPILRMANGKPEFGFVLTLNPYRRPVS